MGKKLVFHWRTPQGAEPLLRNRALTGWPPARLPCVADILAQQEGLEPVLGGLEISDGILTSSGEIPDGLVLDLGNIDRGEVPRTHEAGQLHGIAPVGLDLVAGLLRDERGGPPLGREEVIDDRIPSYLESGSHVVFLQ